MPKITANTTCPPVDMARVDSSAALSAALKEAPFPAHFFDEDLWDGDDTKALPRPIDANAARIIASDRGMRPRGAFDLAVPFFLCRQGNRNDGEVYRKPAASLLQAFADNCLFTSSEFVDGQARSTMANHILHRLRSYGFTVFPVYKYNHAVLMELRISEAGTHCQGAIFNSGHGLEYHLSHQGTSYAANKWPTMLVVEGIPVNGESGSINVTALQEVLNIRYRKDHQTIREVYEWLTSRGQVRYDVPQRLQAEQRTKNCMFKTSKAYVSHRVSEKAYAAFRASMYEETAHNLERAWAHPLLWLRLRLKARRAASKARRAESAVPQRIPPNRVARMRPWGRGLRGTCDYLQRVSTKIAVVGLTTGASLFAFQGSTAIFTVGLAFVGLSLLLYGLKFFTAWAAIVHPGDSHATG